MSKYGDWTRGEDEALLNIIGGVEVARVVLRGERKLHVDPYLSEAVARKLGYYIHTDVTALGQFDVEKLRPSPVFPGELRDDKKRRSRAIELRANWGLCDGERMVNEQIKLSAEFDRFHILLPGTIMLDFDGCILSCGALVRTERGWKLEANPWYQCLNGTVNNFCYAVIQ